MSHNYIAQIHFLCMRAAHGHNYIGQTHFLCMRAAHCYNYLAQIHFLCMRAAHCHNYIGQTHFLCMRAAHCHNYIAQIHFLCMRAAHCHNYIGQTHFLCMRAAHWFAWCSLSAGRSFILLASKHNNLHSRAHPLLSLHRLAILSSAAKPFCSLHLATALLPHSLAAPRLTHSQPSGTFEAVPLGQSSLGPRSVGRPVGVAR